jgi:hypothetical protein
MMPTGPRRRLPGPRVEDFGPLYHGSHVGDLETIDWTQAEHAHHGGMPWGHTSANFAITSLTEAHEYAEGAAETMKRKLGVQFHPHIYEVAPTNRREWGPDVHHGGSWLNEGPQTRREALDLHEGGVPVSLRFERPLKVVRKVSPEEISEARRHMI